MNASISGLFIYFFEGRSIMLVFFLKERNTRLDFFVFEGKYEVGCQRVFYMIYTIGYAYCSAILYMD